MAKHQKELFTPEYPEDIYIPLHPLFKGSCKVKSSNGFFRVNVGTNECECHVGAAWIWDFKKNRWIGNKFCVHKLKALSTIVENNREQYPDVVWAYIKAVATRYNVWEVTSAFHKELRRGDVEEAWFWGCLLMTFRGKRGVIQYMLNIVYEETREHNLARYLLMRYQDGNKATLANVCNGIRWFCAAPKKWELPHRMDIFKAEMGAYDRLINNYGVEVAKPSEIIPESERDLFIESVSAPQSMIEMQYGFKGLQKLAPNCSIKEHRERLMNTFFIEPKIRKTRHLTVLQKGYLSKKNRLCGLGYHDLNMAFDIEFMGEPPSSGELSPTITKRFKLNSKALSFPVGKWPKVPLYAHDNHTYMGKSLIRRFPDQLKPKAIQTKMDLRWCGAYFGVAWRMLAFNQYSTLEGIQWQDVNWPKKLYDTVQKLWY